MERLKSSESFQAEIKLVKRVKYAGDIHKKLVELGWDLNGVTFREE